MGIPEVTIDPNEIVFTDQKTSELRKLVKAILGVVIECEDKKKYIVAMQQMDSIAQKELMKLIEEVEIVTSHFFFSGLFAKFWYLDNR